MPGPGASLDKPPVIGRWVSGAGAIFRGSTNGGFPCFSRASRWKWSRRRRRCRGGHVHWPDREEQFETNASGDHRGPRLDPGRDHPRWLSRLERPGRSRVRKAPPHQQIRRPIPSSPRKAPTSTVSRASGATPGAVPEVQRSAQRKLPSLPQGGRIPLQQPQGRPLEDPSQIMQNETSQDTQLG